MTATVNVTAGPAGGRLAGKWSCEAWCSRSPSNAANDDEASEDLVTYAFELLHNEEGQKNAIDVFAGDVTLDDVRAQLVATGGERGAFFFWEGWRREVMHRYPTHFMYETQQSE